jgi:hypothetical protein
VLWKSLHDLLRPRIARFLQGQPRLGRATAADRAGSAFRLWIPCAVPPGLVEQTLLSAWPGGSLHADTDRPAASGEATLACCEPPGFGQDGLPAGRALLRLLTLAIVSIMTFGLQSLPAWLPSSSVAVHGVIFIGPIRRLRKRRSVSRACRIY